MAGGEFHFRTTNSDSKLYMMHSIYMLGIILGLLTYSGVSAESFPDSDSIKTKIKSSHWRLTMRVHNKGIFSYGGRLASDNPAFDVNFTYERKKWGLLIFKGLDLKDHYTLYNFSLITLFKNFKLSPKVSFTPYIGTFLEQPTGLANHGSDIASILITSVKLNNRVSIEHMSLFGNLIVTPEERDWVNRFRLTCTGKHLDVVSSLWHNNQVFDHYSYWTAGLNVAYSRIKAADHLFLSAGITGLSTFYSSDEEETPTKNTLMITLAAQLVH